MSISFVGSAFSNTNQPAIPANNLAGDLFVFYAVNTASSTAIVLPQSVFILANGSAISPSMQYTIGFATFPFTVSAGYLTFTNATRIATVVYRHPTHYLSVRNFTARFSNTNSLIYNELGTARPLTATTWVGQFMYSNLNVPASAVPPSPFIARQTQADASFGTMCISDTGANVTNVVQNTVAVSTGRYGSLRYDIFPHSQRVYGSSDQLPRQIFRSDIIR